MAFIEKKDPIVMNIKLTSKGRELLSQGKLDFKYFAIGDSEVDYKFNKEINAIDEEYTAFDSSILRAADKNPELISFIPRNLDGDPYNELINVPTTAYQVENEAETLGFFTNDGSEFISDSNHVKQPDLCVYVDTIAGGDVVTLYKTSAFGRSGEIPAVGDLLMIRWTFYESTTGDTVNKTYPTPNLFYRIKEVTEGTLGYYGESSPLRVRVDRNIPSANSISIPNVFAGARLFYNEINYSGDSILNMSETEYLDESVLSFLENNQCPTIVFPFWNMSIIFTEEVAGVQADNVKYTQFASRTLGGFVSYIQNQAPIYKKLGVIHYTNNSPANVYGESLLLNTPVLDIPTIMWHNSTSKELGLKLYTIGGQQLLDGLNIFYYDLADPQGLVVGKVFPSLKIFVIEDQELLYAMSYKSNRSWTLPNYAATTNAIVGAAAPSTGITVTWKYPTNPNNTVTILNAYYCHATSNGWQTIPNGATLTFSGPGIYNTGYRVSACGNPPDGGAVYIRAYDSENNTVIETKENSAGANSQFNTTIGSRNWGNNYCYDGTSIANQT